MANVKLERNVHKQLSRGPARHGVKAANPRTHVYGLLRADSWKCSEMMELSVRGEGWEKPSGGLTHPTF